MPSGQVVRVLVRKDVRSEIVTVPAAGSHTEFLGAVRQKLMRVTLEPSDADHVWVEDRDFPGELVLLTNWPDFYEANERPRAVRLHVRGPQPTSTRVALAEHRQRSMTRHADAGSAESANPSFARRGTFLGPLATQVSGADHSLAFDGPPDTQLAASALAGGDEESVAAFHRAGTMLSALSGGGHAVPPLAGVAARRCVFSDDARSDQHDDGSGGLENGFDDAPADTSLAATGLQLAAARHHNAAVGASSGHVLRDSPTAVMRGQMGPPPLRPAPNTVPWAPGPGFGRGRSQGYTPLRVFLVRHGESETNVDHAVYDSTPDHAVKLTERGRRMAEDAGRALRNFLTRTFGSKRDVDHHIRMYVSPFRRTRETAEGMLRSLNDCNEQWVDSVRESALLAEQDWGAKEGNGRLADLKYQEEMQRLELKRRVGGKFWCRMPNGESPFDVCHRISAFFPDILMAANVETAERRAVKTVIVVSHGITIRAFLASWCRYSPEWFGDSRNPPNCSIQLLEDTADQGHIFGGWDRGTPIDRPVDVVSLARTVDPQHLRWSQFLNQVASSDRRDVDRQPAPSDAEEQSHGRPLAHSRSEVAAAAASTPLGPSSLIPSTST